LATIGAIRRNPFIRAYSSWFAPKNPGFFPGVFTKRKELGFLTMRRLAAALAIVSTSATFLGAGSLARGSRKHHYRPESLAGRHVGRFPHVTIVIFQSSWK